MDMLTIDRIEQHLMFFSKMYDMVRLVDPVEKRVIESRRKCVKKTDEICHHYWGNGKICDNCISVRAHLHNQCFMKLERAGHAIMMVTALPIETSEGATVLELLKNATETMMIGMGTYSDGHMMRDYIQELNERVVKDKLTGIYNRCYVDERLPADIVKSLLEKHPLSIIFLDIDNLKEINDTYGHSYGDRTIQDVANVLFQHIRTEDDWVARYGGDEFVVCLNHTQEKDARQIAERIRTKIKELKVSPNEESTASVSLGLYTMEDTPLTAEELIMLADARLYKAKQQGKNKVVTD